MEKYKIKRKERYPILFPVNGDRCGSCKMDLPMIEMSRLEKETVIECDHCKSLIYKI